MKVKALEEFWLSFIKQDSYDTCMYMDVLEILGKKNNGVQMSCWPKWNKER